MATQSPEPCSMTTAGAVMMEEIRKLFKRFDADGDGRISASELASVLGAMGKAPSQDELDRMMAEMDADGDGFVDFNEYAAFHRGGTPDPDAAELRDAFEMYDLDKNGLISAQELHMVLLKLGENCSFHDCVRMIHCVDSDGDGSVNFAEFRQMMTKGAATSPAH